MKKVGGRLLLCLVLCLTLLSSSLTVFAQKTTKSTNGLDLSNFSDVELKDIGGVYEDSLYLLCDKSYFFLYSDGTKFYNIRCEEGKEPVTEEISASQASKFINNKDEYSLYDDGGKYYWVDSLSALDSGSIKGFYLFMYDSNKDRFYNAGFYKNATSMKDIAKLDLSTKLPTLSATIVEKTASSAKIKVEYSSDSGVSTIVCNDGFSDVKVIDTDTDKYYEGSVTFEVFSNGEYIIEGYNSPYMSKDFDHSEIKIKVDNITDEDGEVKNPDKKAPKVTFSKLPKSAPKGTKTAITMYSDEPAILNFYGTSSNDYVTEMTVYVDSNDTYTYSAMDKSGNITNGSLRVKFFSTNAMTFGDRNSSDRDSFWSDYNNGDYNNGSNGGSNNSDSKLPQTGTIGFVMLILLGLAAVGVGAFFLINTKGKGKIFPIKVARK